jgi:signal transduction histidine kinase
MAADDRPRRRASVRVRLTALTVVMVGAALVIGGVLLVRGVRSTMHNQVRGSARLQALAIAATIDDGLPASAVPVSPSDELLVQVYDGGRRVVSSTRRATPELAALRAGSTRDVHTPLDDEAFIAVATGARGGAKVVVARSSEPVNQSVYALTRGLVIGLPLLLLLVGATTWVVVGRALAPVGAISAEVERITLHALHRRVPEPPGDDEIAALARTTNRMLDRLDRSQQRQAQFVSDASHELRSPVATIRQHAEVALAHPDRIGTRALAETVLAEDLRVQQLLDDMLLLARTDEDAVALRRAPVDLDDVVFDEARRLRTLSALDVVTSDVTACRVLGDEPSLRRIVRNLADNAMRWATARVVFTAGAHDGDARLWVDDDGPGIPPDARERVFERFVRLDDARSRDDGGSGLGLAVAHGLVRASGGTIAAGDSPLGGARFEVRLPAVAEPEPS